MLETILWRRFATPTTRSLFGHRPMHRCTFQTADLHDLSGAIDCVGSGPRDWALWESAKWRTLPDGTTRIIARAALFSTVAIGSGGIVLLGAAHLWQTSRIHGGTDLILAAILLSMVLFGAFLLGHGIRLLRWKRELTITRHGQDAWIATHERTMLSSRSIDAVPASTVRAVIVEVTVASGSWAYQARSLQLLFPDSDPMMIILARRPRHVFDAARRWMDITGQPVLIESTLVNLLEHEADRGRH